ncbi:MAG: hypothetical protein OEW49_04895 [Nitrosopumilus sp.]|nr:hypothetical protein [Nitrosopumilus sp.]
MYKTLSSKIKFLKKRTSNVKGQELSEIEVQIQNYQLELSKIKSMFPEEFFEEL